jgi:hypothetical protein
VSIVRIGLSETEKFAQGYEAIFGKKKAAEGKKTKAKAGAKGGSAKRRQARKK